MILLACLPCAADDAAILKQIKNNLPPIREAAGELSSMAPTLSKVEVSWLKWVALGAGILISVLTLINATYYVLDYKTLKFLSQDAVDAVSLLDGNIQNYENSLKAGPNPEAEKYLRDIASGQKLLARLEEQARQGGQSLRVNLSTTYIREVSVLAAFGRDDANLLRSSIVHAAEGKPDWINKPPYDRFRTGYVGIAACSTPAGARETARYQAMEHAALDLRKEYPNIDLDATVSFVERNAQEGGNFFSTTSIRDYTGAIR